MPTLSSRRPGQQDCRIVFTRILLLAAALVTVHLLNLPVPSAEQPATNSPSFRRLNLLTAEQLQEELLKAPEIDLISSPETKVELEKECAARVSPAADPLDDFAPARGRAPLPLDLQNKRWKALGLTCQDESDRLRFRHEAENLESTARLLRMNRAVSLPDRDNALSSPDVNTFEQLQKVLNIKPSDPLPYHLTRGINQLLLAEGDASRELLVEALARIDTHYSTCCLTERALYDLSPKVREAAVIALARRPREQFRPILLEAMRYPWAPVAHHAAEALVALQDRDALPALTRLLDQPDPAAPAVPATEKKPVVRELVRVNHLRNCFMCHAPSTSRNDLVTAPVPRPGEPLVVLYYGTPRPTVPKAGDLFVRADVTYLRQDFSVMQPVARAAPWPQQQRFDFLVRTREVTAEQAAAAKTSAGSYPQRQAALFAIEGLKTIPARVPASPSSAPLP